MSGETIIKRKKVIAGGGHHGGAWKVAYADFVTAMMAFFLLMWLLNATTEDQRKGIADYFDPSIPISRISGGGDDLLSGSSIFAEQRRAQDGSGGSRGVRGPAAPAADGPEAAARGGAPDADLEAMAGPNAAGSGEMGGEDDAARRSAAIDAERAEKMIADAVASGRDGDLAKHMYMRQTPEGLVIELIDQEGTPLFAPGRASASRRLEQLLIIVADVVGQVVNDVAIVGHTDAFGFRSTGRYSNWELSSDRALAARRILVAAGAPPGQIVEVSGKASSEPLVDDPYAPQNRRISITLLRN
ncbi:MAG: flagellar motor protein MotB [Pseudomonadota bacterium]